MRLDYYQSSLSDGKSTTEDIYNHVKRYRLHSALADIGVVSHKIFRRDPTIQNIFPTVVNEWQLAFIAKALILNSNDHRAKNFQDKGMFDTANIYNNLWDPAVDVSETEELEVRQQALNGLLLRIGNQQFPFQIGVRHLIPRCLYLFDEIPKSLKTPKLDISAEINKIYGMTVKEILIVGFSIFAKSDEGYFNPEHLTGTDSEDLKKWLTTERVDKLVSIATIDYYALRELFKKYDTEKGLEQFSFNPLRTYPLVKTQIAGIVIPIPRFVMERFTSGIYFTLMDAFKASGKENMFLEFFGKELFEKYVGILLKQKYGPNQLLEEWVYGKTKSKTPDWIIIEGDSAILIECKTSGISLEAKSWADLETVQASLRLRAAHGVKQSEKFIEQVRSKQKGLERLFHIKKFYKVIVTYDRIFMSGTPSIRSLIDKELEKEGVKDKDYQVISIDELEKLIPVLEKFSFTDLIDKKMSHDLWSTYDFDVFISAYLKEASADINRENTLLREKYDGLFKEISPKLGLKENQRTYA